MVKRLTELVFYFSFIDLSYLSRLAILPEVPDIHKWFLGLLLVVSFVHLYKVKKILGLLVILVLLSIRLCLSIDDFTWTYEFRRIVTQVIYIIANIVFAWCVFRFRSYLTLWLKRISTLFFTLGSIDLVFHFSGDRLASVFGEPKTFATIGVLLGLYCFQTGHRRQMIVLGSLTLIFVILSESATALVILVALMLLSVKRSFIKRGTTLLAILAVPTLFIASSVHFRERFYVRIINKINGTLSDGQFELMGITLEANDAPIAVTIVENWYKFIIGYGPGADAILTRQVINSFSNLELLQGLDSTVFLASNIPALRIIPEIGFIGFTLLLLFYLNVRKISVLDSCLLFMTNLFIVSILFIPTNFHYIFFITYFTLYGNYFNYRRCR